MHQMPDGYSASSGAHEREIDMAEKPDAMAPPSRFLPAGVQQRQAGGRRRHVGFSLHVRDVSSQRGAGRLHARRTRREHVFAAKLDEVFSDAHRSRDGQAGRLPPSANESISDSYFYEVLGPSQFVSDANATAQANEEAMGWLPR